MNNTVKLYMAQGDESDPLSDMDENTRAALTYLLGWLTGILFLVMEKKSDFVKFHAMQSIITFLGLTVIYILIGSLMAPLMWASPGTWALINTVNTLLILVGFLLWIFLMFKAYNGEKYKLPVVGDIAQDQL